jgi:tetratricopeptide (TPR) repeat protein
MTLLFILSSVLSFSAHAENTGSLRVLELNKQGLELLKKQSYQAAQQKFAEALSIAPYSAELQVNLGLTFDGLSELDKAQQAYDLAAKLAQSPETRFAAHFNIAEIYGRQKKVDEALKFYQLALQDNPDSLEAKTNIELLIQSQKNGGGSGEKNDKDKKDDKKDDKKSDKNKDQNKDDKKDQDGDKDKDQKDKQGYQKNKPQPRPFKSEQLNQGDVKRILEELDRQEQRVRAEYNKKQIKEKPRDKDW